MTDTRYTCDKCFNAKPPTEFHKNKNSKTGHYKTCKECKNQMNKQYTTNKKFVNEGKTRTYMGYKLANIIEQDKKRFPEHVNTLTIEDLIEVFVKYNKTCVYSRKVLKPGSKVNIYTKLSFDRIDNSIPHTKENLQLTSVFMNLMRGELTHDKFKQLIEKYDN